MDSSHNTWCCTAKLHETNCRHCCGITDMGPYAHRYIHQVSPCSRCFTAAVVMEETPADQMQSHQLQATMSDIVN